MEILPTPGQHPSLVAAYEDLARQQAIVDEMVAKHPTTEYSVGMVDFEHDTGQVNAAFIQEVVGELPGGELRYETGFTLGRTDTPPKLVNGCEYRYVAKLKGEVRFGQDEAGQARSFRAATVWGTLPEVGIEISPEKEAEDTDYIPFHGSLKDREPIAVERKTRISDGNTSPLYIVGSRHPYRRSDLTELLLAPVHLQDPDDRISLKPALYKVPVGNKQLDALQGKLDKESRGPVTDPVAEGYDPASRSFIPDSEMSGTAKLTTHGSISMKEVRKFGWLQTSTLDNPLDTLPQSDFESFGVMVTLQGLAARFGRSDAFQEIARRRNTNMPQHPGDKALGVTDYLQTVETGDAFAHLDRTGAFFR